MIKKFASDDGWCASCTLCPWRCRRADRAERDRLAHAHQLEHLDVRVGR